MNYDVIIPRTGPTGYFATYELAFKSLELKICLIDRKLDISKRRCPLMLHQLEKCSSTCNGRHGCFHVCSIANGFGGARAIITNGLA